MQKFAELNMEKHNKMMTGKVISLLDLQEKKKNTNIHLMADETEILEATPKENIPWIDSIHVQSENTTTYSAKGCPKVHEAHKTRSHQAFTRVLMFPTKMMVKATSNKPKEYEM